MADLAGRAPHLPGGLELGDSAIFNKNTYQAKNTECGMIIVTKFSVSRCLAIFKCGKILLWMGFKL